MTPAVGRYQPRTRPRPRACRRRRRASSVTTDLHITGKVAQFGRGIIGDVSKKLMAQFAGNLNTMLDAEPEGANGDAAAATPAEAATEATTDPSPAESTLGGDTPRAATPADEPPKVRKIDSPASEPVDLAGMAGPAILKRLAPVVVGMLLLLFILRRRRH